MIVATLLKVLLGCVVVLLVGVAGLVVSGNARSVILAGMSLVYGPDGDFDPADAAPPPDYSESSYWAALPELDDAADFTPAGVPDGPVQGEAPVDVFFIHPTGFVTGSSWTSTMNPDSAAEENTSWMLAHQASAFNGCCNLYAPRYREASIFANLAGPEVHAAVLGFAYQDVAAAFAHYIEKYNGGRPFIVASHSQGTRHGLRLLREQIAGTPLAERLVAAYLIGSKKEPVTLPYIESLPGIGACLAPTDTGCVVAWDTYGDGGSVGERHEVLALCTNPLSWRADSDMAAAELNRGALVAAWPYNADFSNNAAPGQVTDELPAPLVGHTWAQCRDNVLYVADQSETVFAKKSRFSDEKSYHLLDYSMFYMNIRTNAIDRTTAWLAVH